MSLSVVIPIYNEQENVPLTYDAVWLIATRTG